MADSFTAGQKVTAAILNALFKGGAGWEAYSPSFVAPGSLGNGSLVGAWSRLNGRGIGYRLALTWGSTTAGGAGAFQFTLPTAPTTIGPVGTGRSSTTGTRSATAGPTWRCPRKRRPASSRQPCRSPSPPGT
jgi:hypothetical protein